MIGEDDRSARRGGPGGTGGLALGAGRAAWWRPLSTDAAGTGSAGAAFGGGGLAWPPFTRKGGLAGPGRDGCEGGGTRFGAGDWRMGGVLRGGGWVMRLVFKRRVGGLAPTLCLLAPDLGFLVQYQS